MPPPRLLVVIDAGKRFAHAAYGLEELLWRLGVRHVIAARGARMPAPAQFDGILVYGPPQMALPATDRPLVHVLASSFFGEHFDSPDSVPEPPFAGQYPSPAFFTTPQEFFGGDAAPNRVRVQDDLVASAYVLLAGHEERTRPVLDQHGRFNGRASLLFRGGLLERPLVEDYAADIAQAFERAGLALPPRPAWPGGAAMALCLTSDVDLPRRNTWRAIGRAMLRRGSIYEDKQADPPSALSYVPHARGQDPYLDLAGMARRGGIPGAKWTFFFLAGKRSKMEPYSLEQDAELVVRARDLAAEGHEIALHAPFACWREAADYRAAMEAFSKASGGQAPLGVRQHYLHARIPATWRAQAQAGLAYDAGAAFACCEGFRFGTALPFRAFDAEAGRALPLWVIPMVAMDATLRYYRRYAPGEAAERLGLLAAEVRRVGGVFNFLWHNSSVGPGWEAWQEVFDTFIHSLAEVPLWTPTCAQLLAHWRQVTGTAS